MHFHYNTPENFCGNFMSDHQKRKGLGKLKFYCQLCSKQCRDANGLKNHSEAESHKAKQKLYLDDPDKFISEFSSQFQAYFLELLEEMARSDWIAAPEVYKEVVRDPDHVHLNSTRWKDLTDFLNCITEAGLIRKRPRERGGGPEIQYIDKDFEEKKKREKLDEKRKLERLAEKELEDSEKRMRIATEQQDSTKPVSAPTELQRTDTSAKIKFSFGAKPLTLNR